MSEFDRIDEPSGFAKPETAQKVRDLLGMQAKRIVQQQAPQPMTGRVVSVDEVRLKGMVWLVGDSQPVEVNFFAGTMPATWQNKKDVTPSGFENTSTSGYGSQVTVERLNGALFVTQILTGGQFSYRQEIMGLSIVQQQPTNGFWQSTDSVGNVGETIVNVRVGFQTCDSGDALFFGPFMRKNGSYPEVGMFEINIKDSNGSAARSYKVNLDPVWEMNNTGGYNNHWYRLLPDHELSSSESGNSVLDWDLDVAVVNTLFSAVAGQGTPSFWLRAVKRSTSTPDFNLDVSIRSTCFQRVGGFNAEQTFYQARHINAPMHSGVIGFHNASAGFESPGRTTIQDNFGRVLSSGWGSMHASPSKQFGEKWTTAGIASVEQYYGKLTAQTANSSAWAHLQDTYTDSEMYAEFEYDKRPVGDMLSIRFTGRERGSGSTYNSIICQVEIEPDGDLKLTCLQYVNNVGSYIGSTSTYGWTATNAGDRIRVRWRIVGTAWYAKVWVGNNAEPRNWTMQQTIAAPAAGISKLTFVSYASATNPPWSIRFYEFALRIKNEVATAVTGPWNTGPWRSSLLRAGSDLQKLWKLYDGSFKWNGSALSWTGDIIFTGLGRNRNILADGYTRAGMPTSGSEIPVMGAGGYRTVDPDGIPLFLGESLYMAVEPGIGTNSDNRFFIVPSFDLTSPDYYLPEWAVLIASNSNTGGAGAPALRMGDGTFLDYWRPLSLTGGWFVYVGGGGYSPAPEFTLEGTRSVRLRGLIRHATTSTTGTMFNIPAGFRPEYTGTFIVFANSGVARVIVDASSGNVSLSAYYAGGTGNLVALEQISFLRA